MTSLKPAASVVLVVLLSACAAPAPTGRPADSRTVTAATPTSSASPVSPADLAEIVVAPEETPAGLNHDTAAEGPPVLTKVVISGREAEFLALRGFVEGRYAEFSSEDDVLLSLGLRFDGVDNADAALDLYLDELESDAGYGFGQGADAEMGDEGTCDDGDNPALGGLHESVCVWRNGDLVLIAGGTLEPDELRAVAEEMDRRAR